MSEQTLPYMKHETAIVDAGAEIGKGSKVWHWVHICGGAKIGEGCVFGQNVFVGNRVRLGKNVKVQNNVSIYDNVYIEDDVFCGPSMVFTNVINPRSEFVRKDEYLDTNVRKGATIGANATIVCGAELGEYCFIAAGAVVKGAVPAYALMAGVPAKQKGWMSRYGERLDLPVFAEGTQTLKAVCASTGDIYTLQGPKLTRTAKA